jgi:CBS-domain-containing membrane protein
LNESAAARGKALLGKMRGDGAALPPGSPPCAIGLAALGGVIAIALIAGLTEAFEETLILGSFGATCVLVFGFRDVPFSQPRNVVAGHFLSTLSGLVFFELSSSWWSVGLAVGVAIAAMMATRTVHPPAGSNAVIVVVLAAEWRFLIFPTLMGALLVVLVALVYNTPRARLATRSTGDGAKYW